MSKKQKVACISVSTMLVVGIVTAVLIKKSVVTFHSIDTVEFGKKKSIVFRIPLIGSIAEFFSGLSECKVKLKRLKCCK